MFQNSKRTILASAALCLLTLTACGGGGGGGSSSAPTTSNLSGVASKGLILNGVATAYRINGDGTRGTALQSVRTDRITGAYAFTGLPAGVPVLVEVTGVAGETTMQDEATGQPVALDGTFKLRAATVTGGSGTVALQVTPYSEMAVVLATASGGLTADNVQKANLKVIGFAGEDVINVAPVFDANGKALNAAAVKLAAVSQLASSGAVGAAPCAGATLDKIKCTVAQMSSQGIDSDAVVSALQAAQNTIASDAAKVAQQAANSVQPLEKQTAGLPTGPVLSAIQRAKSLIQSVRNLGTALSSQAEGSLRGRMVAVDAATKALPDVLPRDLFAGLDTVARATEVLTRPLYLGTVGTVGRIEVVKDVRCVFVTTTSVDCRRNLVVDASAVTQFRVELSVDDASVPTFNAVSSIVRQAGAFDASGLVPSGAPTTLSERFVAVVSDLLESNDPNITQDTLVFQGDLPLGVSGPTTVLPGKAVAALHLQEVGTPSAPTRYNVRGTLTQRLNGASYVTLLLQPGSRIDESSNPSTTNTVAMHLDLQADVVNATGTGYRFAGVLDSSAYLPRQRDNLPGTVAFNGSAALIEAGALTPVFTGQVQATGLIDRFGDASNSGRSGSVALTLQVPELSRTVTLTLSNVTEVDVGEYTFAGSFSDGSNQVSFTGSDLAGDANDTITFRVVDVTTTYTPALRRGIVPLTRTGSTDVLGQFDVSRSRVTFADGSYQQF